MLGFRLVLALALVGPAPGAPPAAQIDGRPYLAALGAVTNLESCGVDMTAPAYRPVAATLAAAEARGRDKGLGSELDRLHAQYLEMLAISTSVACVGGPRGALAEARRAVAAFRAWVDAQPALR